jgi:nicotinate phosphoribosyltransferase
MATGDLNEYKILELVATGAPIDAFGVGTDLATSSDAPSLGAVYKLVEMDVAGERRYTAKYSEDKATLPGAKQVFRYAAAMSSAARANVPRRIAKPCCGPLILQGKLVQPLPSAAEARARARAALDRMPKKLRSLFECDPAYPVELSDELRHLMEEVRRQARVNGT